MSYCRWSSMGFQCDIYAYETGSGYVVHVAKMRRAKPIPDYDPSTPETFRATYAARIAALEDKEGNPLLEIGGPFDGDTFHETTLEDFELRMIELRNAGYKFPDDVFVHIGLEMRERDANERGQQ